MYVHTSYCIISYEVQQVDCAFAYVQQLTAATSGTRPCTHHTAVMGKNSSASTYVLRVEYFPYVRMVSIWVWPHILLNTSIFITIEWHESLCGSTLNSWHLVWPAYFTTTLLYCYLFSTYCGWRESATAGRLGRRRSPPAWTYVFSCIHQVHGAGLFRKGRPWAWHARTPYPTMLYK